MATQQWLRLTDYSSKYRVSISTLRRRIKSGQLEHRFEEGRYYVADEAPTYQEPSYETAQEMRRESTSGAANESPQQQKEEPILSSANRLLSELKLAYMNILHEKEEQIIDLKAELSDLKTLVRVLEDDNNRLRSEAGHPPLS